MSKFVRYFHAKPDAKAWIEKCKKNIPGCNYGATGAVNRGGYYQTFISGEFTEEEALSLCPKTIKAYKYEP